MSTLQVGNNASLSGIICFPTLATGDWRVRIYAVGDSWKIEELNDAGRGDGLFPGTVPGNATGSVVCSGKVTRFGFPSPTLLNGATGTLTIQFYTGVTQTMSVRVHDRGISFKIDTNDNYDIKLTATILAMPTMDGWPGSQGDTSVTPPADKMQWSGMSKTMDPATVILQQGATERLRVWGVTDSDAAEVTELQSHFADTAPISGLKLLPLTIDRVSANVVYLNFRWDLNNTNDQALNPYITRMVDPSAVATWETTTALNATPASPTVSGLLSRGNTFTKLNDGATQQKTAWGVRSTIQDITFPGTPTSIDKIAGTGGGGTGSTIALQSFKGSTQVTNVATEPSWNPGGSPALKKRKWTFTQMTDAGAGNLYEHHLEAGLTTIQEDIENGGSVINIDPSGIGTFTVHERVLATATTADPDAAVDTTGLSLYDTFTRELHDNAFERRFVYRPLTREEELEHDGTTAIASNVNPQTTTAITNVEVIVSDCATTATAQSLALAAQAIYLNTDGYESVSATKINKTKVRYHIVRKTDDLTIFESDPTTREEATATQYTYGGAITAAAAVIADQVQVGTSLYRKMLGEFSQWVTYKSILVRRRKINIDNASDARYQGYEGAVNNDSFLDYAAGTVQFVGSSQETSWKSVIEGANHSQQFDLHFLYRSVGFWGSRRIQVGRWFLSSDTHTIGGTPALSQLRTGWAVDLPPYARFGTPTVTVVGTITTTIGANFLG